MMNGELEMRTKLHVLIIKGLRVILRLFSKILPLNKNKILLCSYLGDSWTCNPGYLYQYGLQYFPGKFEYVWALNRVSNLPEDYQRNEKTSAVKYKSLKWIIESLTAGTVVTNNGAVWIPRRKGQLIIDTWHGGGCYKKVSTDKSEISDLERYRARLTASETNLFLSSSKYFTDNVIRKSFGYSGRVLNSGMPRNDALVSDKQGLNKALRKHLADKYGFQVDDYLILFAPTWREKSERTQSIDVLKLRKAGETLSGKNVALLGRGHHTESHISETEFVDVTDYPDMQELLQVADLLITDYSSSIWDFSFTGKPCVLYTPDLDSYTVFPGFDEDIYTWGFPVARSNDELVEEIEHFNFADYQNKMVKHHQHLVSYENGNASQQVFSYMMKNNLGEG